MKPFATTSILGIPVSLLDMPHAVDTVLQWVLEGSARYVCLRDVHGIMCAQEDTELRQIHERAGMVTPDGMPLVWICNWRGHRHVQRVCGADLVAALAEKSAAIGLRHYFYGGKPGVSERMAAKLVARYPGFVVAGTSTPPFSPMTAEEDEAVIQKIVETRPHIVWVGLGTPKQEFWMRDHVGRIPNAILLGVGAAFDFYAGDVKRAPRWMQNSGLEWLHRLASEPRRLWRRYLILAPKFVFKMITSELHGSTVIRHDRTSPVTKDLESL